MEVFLYKDSKDRIIATTNRPLVCVGEVGKLKVSQVTKIGAFLDWGLEKDVLLPYKEQTAKVMEGDEVLAGKPVIDRDERTQLLPDLIHCAAHDIILPIPAAPFQMSKNEFKRAVGNLLKNGRIEIKPGGIRLK